LGRRDLSTLKQDDLYTRFEKLFKEFFGSPVSFGIVIKPDEFRRLFYHSWDQKVLPSKEILVQAVHIKPTPLVFLEEVGDHVENTFALALEKLRIEEHNQEASLPEKPQQKAKPGRKAHEEIRRRREIVKKHIHAYKRWFNPSIQGNLLDELDGEEVPLPKNSDTFTESIQIWAEFLDHPDDWKRVVDKVLNRDRWR